MIDLNDLEDVVARCVATGVNEVFWKFKNFVRITPLFVGVFAFVVTGCPVEEVIRYVEVEVQCTDPTHGQNGQGQEQGECPDCANHNYIPCPSYGIAACYKRVSDVLSDTRAEVYDMYNQNIPALSAADREFRRVALEGWIARGGITHDVTGDAFNTYHRTGFTLGFDDSSGLNKRFSPCLTNAELEAAREAAFEAA